MQRREFILTVATAGGAALLQISRAAPTTAATVTSWAPSAWLEFFSDGGVVIRVHKSEMGQGVATALPMLVAEELELPLSRVRVELAPGRREFRDVRGNQTTGYSSSISSSFVAFQSMGASAREMLLAAAALRLAVPRSTLQAKDGWISELTAGGRRLGYHELLDAARAIAVPSAPALKAPAARRLIGQSPTRIDTPAKVDGSAIFGIDVHVPGARVACVARCPMLGGKLQSYDARAALRQRGVQAVVPISSGLAVVAHDFWSAQRGRELLKVRWQSPQTATADSAAHHDKLFAALERPGLAGHLRGDLQALDMATNATPRVLSADYWTPFLAHAAMEPLAATAHVQKERCDIWLGTQAPSRAQDWGAKITGLPVDSVYVHNHFIGGAFGRRGEWDFVVDAVETSRAVGAPVKVVWTRADDMQHDFYRPASANRLRGEWAADGKLLSLTHRLAAPSVARRRNPEMLDHGADFLLTQGSSDLRYAIGNLRVDYHEVDLGVPVGFWRSVGHSHTGFVLESFIDELAVAAGRDPLEFRLAMLADQPRLAAVLRLAAERAQWGTPLPRGSARGIACMESYGTYVAQVAQVHVSEGNILVERVVCALDCGQAVHPGIIEQQMHGGIVFGLSAALSGEITFAGARVLQSNFHDYPVLRIQEMPRIDVYRIASDAAPGGCGEPATPLIAPAVANAIFSATGQRLRSLPLRL